MSDGVPTEEQLARIERGVTARIRRRRSVAHGIAGSAVAVLLLGGGFALLPHVAGSGASGSGSAAGTSGGGSSAVVVECHESTARDSAVRTEKVTGALPGAAAAVCGYGTVEFQSGSDALTSDSAAASDSSAATPSRAAPAASPPQAIVCRSKQGVLHVFPTADPQVCTRNGLLPF